jgi:hypothetical protein
VRVRVRGGCGGGNGSHWVIDRCEDLHSSRDIEVYTAGIQKLDGTVKYEIVLNQVHADDPITVQQGRELAQGR